MKYYKDLDFNISCIDTTHIRHKYVASYLIKSDDEYAFIDSGTYLSVPNLLATLDDKNIAYDKVRYIIATHVHLDHAGGVGRLLQFLPNAKVVAHSSCAKHLIDPTTLKQSSIAVYGELFFQQKLGDIIPVPENLIIIANEQIINLNNRKLQLMTTYGHAYHHISIIDKLSNGVFSGDTLGVSYNELNNDKILIFPPTTPTQFSPQEWKDSIDRITATKVNKAYLTHYNKINWNSDTARQLKQRIDDFCAIAITHKNKKNRTNAIKIALLDYLASKVININTSFKEQQKILLSDITICAQGLDIWLNKL